MLTHAFSADSLSHSLWHYAYRSSDAAAAPASAVLTVNSIRLAQSRESRDACAHGRHSQTDLVGGNRALPITSFARGRDPHAAPPAQRAPTKSPEATRLQQLRSPRFYQPL